MKSYAQALLIGFLLLIGIAHAQHPGRDLEYDAFVQQWKHARDPWMRFKPQELRTIEPALVELRGKYPDNDWLKYAHLRLLAEKKDWQGVRTILESSSRPEGDWSQRWRLHAYWQLGDYSSLLRSDALRDYLRLYLLRLLLPVAVFLYSWRLARLSSTAAIRSSAMVCMVISILVLPYDWLSGIAVAGAPFPIAYGQEQMSNITRGALLFGTLLFTTVMLLRRYGSTLRLMPSERNWLLVPAAVLLVTAGFWYIILPLWRNPEGLLGFVQASGQLRGFWLLSLGVRFSVIDVALALFFVLLAYRAVRNHLGIVLSLAYTLLLALATAGPWWELDQMHTMLRFALFSLLPAVMMYEQYRRFWAALIPFWWSTIMASFGTIMSHTL